MDFNPNPPTVMHVDINSCFATIEQQANPLLRGRPTVVAAYAEDHGCILAASREAKKMGITTGMRVAEARSIFRNVVVLSPDPEKYRFVNRKLRTILGSYTPNLNVESIDEMVLSLAGTPVLEKYRYQVSFPRGQESVLVLKEKADPRVKPEDDIKNAMIVLAHEIKQRIKTEIGEWITVSIGVAPNRYLAKIASNLHKPDGLDIICRQNIVQILGSLELEDLTGIKKGNGNRLRYAGITTPLALYEAAPDTLERAFHSIVGYYWFRRLHGYEDGSMYKEFGERDSEQKSFGQSHALGKPKMPADPELWQILSQLVVKMARRLRSDGFTARGDGVSTMFTYSDHWHAQKMQTTSLFADTDFYKRMHNLLLEAPSRPVRILAVNCYELRHDLYEQQSLLGEEVKKERLTRALDAISDRWGDFVVTPGRMLVMNEKVLDRIAFGRIRELNR